MALAARIREKWVAKLHAVDGVDPVLLAALEKVLTTADGAVDRKALFAALEAGFSEAAVSDEQ